MNWLNLPEHDHFLFARSHHVAAIKLARTLDIDPGPITEFDFSPVLSAYRHSIELHLKVIVLGEGGNFLPTRPDDLLVHKTSSLSWLAQFVTQIVTEQKWEVEFNTEGVSDLADFEMSIAEANDIDTPFQTFRCPASCERPESVRSVVLEPLRRRDALVELPAQTTDALAVK